jgi:hypothetical protein
VGGTQMKKWVLFIFHPSEPQKLMGRKEGYVDEI